MYVFSLNFIKSNWVIAYLLKTRNDRDFYNFTDQISTLKFKRKYNIVGIKDSSEELKLICFKNSFNKKENENIAFKCISIKFH